MSTSAAASVQETPSPDGANACHFMVVYEDVAAHDLAMEVCGGVVASLKPTWHSNSVSGNSRT